MTASKNFGKIYYCMSARHNIDTQARQLQMLWGVTIFIFIALGIVALSNVTSLTVAFIAILGALTSIGSFMWGRRLSHHASVMLDAYQDEAALRNAADERVKAIYELAATLSSTLNYQEALETIQNLGRLALQNPLSDVSLTSVALLYRHDDDLLHVANSRRLTLADDSKTIRGQAGVIGNAMQSGEPVFGNNASEDEELRYFSGFHDMRSVVAVPLKAGFQNFGVVVFGCTELKAFREDTKDLLAALGTQATIAMQNAVLYESVLSEKERIVKVEEDARKKFAHDLHDGPTQTISAIFMRAGMIQKSIRQKKLEQAHKELSKVAQLAERATKEIRHMIFALRPLALESQGLVAALKEMAKKTKDTYDLTVSVEAQTGIERYLEENAQGAMFYVIEEAVNNARKHAEANGINIRLYRQGNYCMIEIEDDGKGFEVQEVVNTDYHKRGSLGMVSMRERAELVEGELALQSAKGRGTKISIRIPISKSLLISDKRQVLKTKDTQPKISLKDTRFSADVSTDDVQTTNEPAILNETPVFDDRDDSRPSWQDILKKSH